jgi:Rrf2 family protein
MRLEVDHGRRIVAYLLGTGLPLTRVALPRRAHLARELSILDSNCDNATVRISAKADYAVRASLELAAAEDGKPVKGERLADAQDIPLQFLEHILLELKHARLVRAKRGARGGYWLARPADDITLADVIRAVEGPLANIQDSAPESTSYPGPAEQLREVWVAVRANLRAVLEQVTLADLTAGDLPEPIRRLTEHPDAWVTR